jgi:hypothetical protein
MGLFSRVGSSVLKGVHSAGKIIRRIGDVSSNGAKTLHGSNPLIHGLSSAIGANFGAAGKHAAAKFNRGFDRGVAIGQLVGNRASVAGSLLSP